jgi:hypothetical protein
VFNDGGGIIVFTGSTIANNSAAGGAGAEDGQGVAGGIFALKGTVELHSTIVAANTADRDPDLGWSNSGPGLPAATFQTFGNNLIGQLDNATLIVPTGTDGQPLVGIEDQVGTTADPLDPELGPLGDTGGGALTHVPFGTSLAVDRGSLNTGLLGLLGNFRTPSLGPRLAGRFGGELSTDTSSPLDARGLPRDSGGGTGVADVGATTAQRDLLLTLPEGAHARFSDRGRGRLHVQHVGGTFFESFSFGTPLETLTIREADAVAGVDLASIWEIHPLDRRRGDFTISLETVGEGDRVELTRGAELNTPGGVLVDRLDTLGGDGTVFDGLTVTAEGRVEPAAGQDLLVTGNVLLEPEAVFVATLGVFVITLSDEDELEVVEAGTLAVSGETSTIGLGGAVLELNLPPAFDPDPNTVVTLIRNETGSETTTPISGRFDGLPEGAEFTVDGVNFRITYVGGTLGHDV